MTRLEKLKDAMYCCKFEIEMGKTTFGFLLVSFVEEFYLVCIQVLMNVLSLFPTCKIHGDL